MSTLLQTTNAESTTESRPVARTGTSLQPLEQDVARHSTLIGSEYCVNDAVKVITAMCLALMDQTLSSDSMWFAARQAEDMAIKAGVPPVEAERIVKEVGQAWLARRRRNPLSGMF